MDTTQFRDDFPEFADTAKYSESSIKLWLDFAKGTLDPCRWGSWYSVGLELYAAHHLVLAARDEAQAAKGGIPGQVQGINTSMAVDKVSKSMDVLSVTEKDGGFWNLTTYGIRFLRMAKKIGTGGIQVGAGGTPPVPGFGSIAT